VSVVGHMVFWHRGSLVSLWDGKSARCEVAQIHCEPRLFTQASRATPQLRNISKRDDSSNTTKVFHQSFTTEKQLFDIVAAHFQRSKDLIMTTIKLPIFGRFFVLHMILCEKYSSSVIDKTIVETTQNVQREALRQSLLRFPSHLLPR
jgi:hypothetical protein